MKMKLFLIKTSDIKPIAFYAPILQQFLSLLVKKGESWIFSAKNENTFLSTSK